MRRLTAYSLGLMQCQKHAGAVSRRPTAIPDALVYELYGLTEEEIRVVERRESQHAQKHRKTRVFSSGAASSVDLPVRACTQTGATPHLLGDSVSRLLVCYSVTSAVVSPFPLDPRILDTSLCGPGG